MFRKIELLKNVYLLEFNSRESMCKAFVRIQEHYESPKFRGKIFGLDEFKEWYSSHNADNKFTYYADWNGMNVPSYVLSPFFRGEFDPMHKEEKELVDSFKDIKDTKFYVIGSHAKTDRVLDIITHEIAHALYYTNEDYRKWVDVILGAFNTEEIQKELKNDCGYHQDVLMDEVHAYSLSKKTKYNFIVDPKMKSALRKNLFDFIGMSEVPDNEDSKAITSSVMLHLKTMITFSDGEQK